jgi:hypothetical protein
MIAYDYVRTIEDLPDSTEDDLGIDDVAMMVVESMVVFDHAKNIVKIVALADGSDEGYEGAKAEIERINTRLQAPLPSLPTFKAGPNPVTANVEREAFEDGVKRIIEYIGAGDCIQAVPSIRFETEVGAHPLSIYRALRSLNPSPYMFYLQFGADGRPQRARGQGPADRRDQASGRDTTGGRVPREGPAGRRKGAGRAHHAGGPRPQRPRAGVRVRVRQGRRADDR